MPTKKYGTCCHKTSSVLIVTPQSQSIMTELLPFSNAAFYCNKISYYSTVSIHHYAIAT